MRRIVLRTDLALQRPLSYWTVINMQYRRLASFVAACTVFVLVALSLTACEGEKPRVGSTLTTASSTTTLPLTPLQTEAVATGDALLVDLLKVIAQLTASPDPNAPAIASSFKGQGADQVRTLLQNLIDKGLRLEGTLAAQSSASRVTSTTDIAGVLSGFRYQACVDDEQYPVVVATGDVRAGSPLDSAYEIDFVRDGDVWIAERLLINGPGLRCLAPNQPPATEES